MAPSSRSPAREHVLSNRELNRALLARQGLLTPLRTADAGTAVRSVLSLQAQHPEWPPLALASRVSTRSAANVRGALKARHSVRASLMRITIHVVHADDLASMVAACRPMRLNQLRLLLKCDPVDGPLAQRIRAAHPAVVEALATGPKAQRDMERILVAESGIDGTTVPARILWRHFTAFVPTVHVPWEGEGYGRSRYAPVATWLPTAAAEIDADTATTTLGERYLSAFGPATAADFAQYVGLVSGIVRWRKALDAIGDGLVRYRSEDGRDLLDLAGAPLPSAKTEAPPKLLARWDSVLLSHEPRARQRIIAEEHRPLVYTKNADVLPTFTVDGFVAGTWQLDRGADWARVRFRPFRQLPAETRRALADEADRILRLVLPAAADRDVAFVAPPG